MHSFGAVVAVMLFRLLVLWSSFLAGGRMGLFGTLPSVANGPALALATSPSLQGIGMTMEALSNNYVMYALLCGAYD